METLRKIKRWLDGLFIWLFGRRVLIQNVIIKDKKKDALYHEDREKEWESPVELYSLYTLPDISEYQNMFGIDAPDEIALELNYADTIKRLGKIPTIGSKIITLDNGKREWLIIQRNIQDHRIWGSGRLVLVLQMYCESVTTGKVEAHSSLESSTT